MKHLYNPGWLQAFSRNPEQQLTGRNLEQKQTQMCGAAIWVKEDKGPEDRKNTSYNILGRTFVTKYSKTTPIYFRKYSS